jgi:hypothetical protein
MTCFTDNPLERLMRQKPLPAERKDKADTEDNSPLTIAPPKATIPQVTAATPVAEMALL